jgi:IclR family transcriptional regulator, KDG regulon repressor
MTRAIAARNHGRGMDTKPDKIEGKRLSSVATAIQLLKAFSEDEVEIGISTLARRLGVAKSTVHRLAVTLVSEGLLEQDRHSGKYRLGIALFRLGTLVRRRMNVSEEARPHLFQLRQKTNETVHLAILDGADIMYVYFLESTQAIRMRSELGLRKPAYCTAEGQAILAFSPPDVVQAVIGRGLIARTPQTITEPAALIKALEAVRQRGCAIDDEESEIGVRCVAAPIRNDAGEVVAAVGVAGPVSRLSKKSLAAVMPHVIETADAISARIGHRARAGI